MPPLRQICTNRRPDEAGIFGEDRRHSAIESLQILNTLPEDAYERIVRRVSEYFGVPICLITIAYRDHLWFKAKVGVDLEEVPRDRSFCQAALDSGELFVVPDARVCPRFCRHPFVVGEPCIRFYAGVPLRLDDGALVGTLCVIDTKPHVFGTRESVALKDFAALVVDELHLRLRTLTLEAELRRQQAAEAFALAQQKERADFLAMVTHEVRAPLNAIAGMVSLICEGAPRALEEVGVEALRESSEHLVRMINEVLDLAKLEATGFTFNREAFDLRRELRCALAVVRRQLESNGIALELQVAPDVPAFVIGDRTRVSQIVLNLLGNAAKFTSQGSVTLSVSALPSADDRIPLAIRVQDTGIGMEPEAVRHLFTGFSQADPDVRARYGGTGLGLAICQKLVRAMHGEIHAESTPGVGTTFTCTIPFEAAAQPLAVLPAGAGAAASRPDNLVLVADDDDVSRRVSKAVLSRLGYRVESVSSGRDALAALRTRPFDLAVLDINMPDIDGFSLARELRAQTEFGPPVPLIALTGTSLEPGDPRLDLFDDYLVKPLNSGRLDAAIQRVLSRRDGIVVTSIAGAEQ